MPNDVKFYETPCILYLKIKNLFSDLVSVTGLLEFFRTEYKLPSNTIRYNNSV